VTSENLLKSTKPPSLKFEWLKIKAWQTTQTWSEVWALKQMKTNKETAV